MPRGGSWRIVEAIIEPPAARKILEHVRKIKARANAPPPPAG
ncbi:MAG: hypothetical protein Q9Q13_11270 [Acidobacteriota bacterium]|nr:hypothetical protein [Acidobacteriota bacterium]